LRTTKTRSKRGELPFVGGLSLYAINITDKKAPCSLRNAPSFLFFLPFFWENDARFFPPLPFAVSSSPASYARTDTPLRIAHSASSQFLPSPFTFTCNLLIHRVLQVKDYAFFAFTGEGKRGEAFTHKSLFHSFLPSYGEEVKANNEKRRTRA